MAKQTKSKGEMVVPAQVSMQVSFDQQLETVQTAMLKRADAEKLSRTLREELVETLNKHNINMRGVALTDSNLQEILDRIVVRKTRPPLPKNFPSETSGYSEASDAKGILRYFGGKATNVLGAKAVKALQAVIDHYGDMPRDEAATTKLRADFTAKFHQFTAAVSEYEAQKTIIADAKEFVGYVKDVASIAAASK